MIKLWCGHDDIRRDATASGNLPAAVREPDLRRMLRHLAFVMIFVERNGFVIALDQPSARCVVTRCGQRKSGVLAERLNRLDQALAKGYFANDQPAVMILHRS